MKKSITDPSPVKMINELKLDLACGQNKQEGYFGIDIFPGDKVDAVVDLEIFPWPIESNSADEIVCSHYVEHTPKDTVGKQLLKALSECSTYEELKERISKFDENAPTDGLIKFMNEVYRILKPGGKLKVVAPYYNSIRCWQDPTHTRAINEATFMYYNKEWRTVNRLDHYPINCDFDFTYGYDMSTQWATRADDARNFGTLHYNNVINDIHVVLTKR
jgi:predicted SAM-dependent methyltransferase